MPGAIDHDLLIVGGGPAGLATALFLVSAAPHLRERIAVLEGRSFPREKICAGAIGARADRALASIGVVVDVPSVAVRGLSVVTPVGRLVSRRSEPIGRVVRRFEHDAALAKIAGARGVTILEGHRVTGLDHEGDAVRLSIEGEGSLRARLVVGADGVGSVVRRSLGLGRGTLMAQAVEVDTEASSADGEEDLLHFDLTDQSLRGYEWDFATIVSGEKQWCRGIYELLPERTPGKAPLGRGGPDVSARLAASLDGRQIAFDPARFKRFAERGLALHEPAARPSVLLVGEAAGIDPILGEGIAQAILYGQAAGPYLARCLERRAYGLADWHKTLSSSRVGLDLAIRTRLAPWVYDRARPLAERFVTRSPPFAEAGMHYLAGDHVPRRLLLQALAGLARAALG